VGEASGLSRPAQLALALSRQGPGHGATTTRTVSGMTQAASSLAGNPGLSGGPRTGDAYRRNAHLKAGGTPKARNPQEQR